MNNYNNREKRVECCVLVADVNNCNYYYKVSVPKIEEATLAIKAAFKRFHSTCNRVYIAGFMLETEKNVMNRTQIIEKAIREAKKNSEHQVTHKRIK